MKNENLHPRAKLEHAQNRLSRLRAEADLIDAEMKARAATCGCDPDRDRRWRALRSQKTDLELQARPIAADALVLERIVKSMTRTG